jgi:hypothetical protein
MSFVHFSGNPKICGACSENGAKQISLEVFALHLKKIVIDLVTGGCEDRLETTFANIGNFVISIGLSHAPSAITVSSSSLHSSNRSVIYPPREFNYPWSDKDSLHLNFLAWKEQEVSILLSVYYSRG